VYLLSFLPQNEVERVVDYASGQGRRSFAALVPDTTYGSVVEGAFREAASRSGVRVAGLERYAPGQPAASVSRLAPLFSGQIDAILIPAPGDDLPAIGSALQAAGFSPGRVKPLGTGLWNDPRVAGVPAMQGGWFASPDTAGFTAFAGRYRARFGAEPTRIATLSYDAVSLAAALARTQGPARYSEAALQAPTGFSGVDGVFRFRPDGTNERALAVNEVRGEGAAVISPAPKAFGSTG
jgi:ABC-type branched-subunit amino acid transport system substrate-binding protein